MLITSRNDLSGLVAREGARRLILDRLPLGEAVALLRVLVGATRIEADPDAVADLARRCARLPLALRIAAELIASRPGQPLAGLVAGLDRHRLDRLDVSDDQTATRSVFSWSYRHLPAEAALAFRLLGVHPGRDFDAYQLAALADLELKAARALAMQLRKAHLVETDDGDRLYAHDLLREYAAERASTDPEPTRRRALTRLLDYYTYTVSTASGVLYPHEADQWPHVPTPDTPVPALDDGPRAAAWLDAELTNLLAAACSASADHPGYTLRLSAVLHRHLRTRARYTEAQDLHRHALRTARRTGDREAEREAMTGLGHIHSLQGRYDPAVDCYQQALDLAQSTEHRIGEVNALIGLGHVRRMRDRYDSAVDCYQQALDLARSTEHRAGALKALIGLGNVRCQQGRYDLALDHYQPAMDLAGEIGDRAGRLSVLNGLGHVHYLQGRHAEAANWYGRALDLARAVGHRVAELTALVVLGHIHRAQGRHNLAIGHYRQIMDIADEIGDPNLEYEALQGLGQTHLATGNVDEALTACQHALDLAEALGQPGDTARAHNALARTHHCLGHTDQARHHWRLALAILADPGLSGVQEVTADEIRAQLAELDRQHPKHA